MLVMRAPPTTLGPEANFGLNAVSSLESTDDASARISSQDSIEADPETIAVYKLWTPTTPQLHCQTGYYKPS